MPAFAALFFVLAALAYAPVAADSSSAAIAALQVVLRGSRLLLRHDRRGAAVDPATALP